MRPELGLYIVGCAVALPFLVLWVWSLTEAFAFRRAVWARAGHSRPVMVAMCTILMTLGIGPFVFAVAVRPALVRAERELEAVSSPLRAAA